MIVDLAPRQRLADYLAIGWRLIAGHDYRPDDFAILVEMPANPVPATPEEWQDAVSIIYGRERQATHWNAGRRRICRHGHQLTSDNTYIRPGDGKRECRTCRRERYEARQA